VFEGFVGALGEDFGIDDSCRGYIVANKFVINCIENAIDITELIMKDDNYKDQLMRYFQLVFEGNYRSIIITTLILMILR
jgi:hypothetical protein